MKGFTLVELLVALAILSVIFFYMAPKTIDIFKVKKNIDAEKLSGIVQAAYKKAAQTGMPQIIMGMKGSNNVHFNKKLYHLSKSVFESKVDENYQSGIEYMFFVYPSGVMDRVKLTLYGQEKLISYPLLLRFDVE